MTDAEGAILAHSLRLEDGVLRKGRILDRDDIALLASVGVASVVAARLEEGDLNENQAALKIADALQNEGLTAFGGNAGRANLRADAAGIPRLSRKGVLKHLDQAQVFLLLQYFERFGIKVRCNDDFTEDLCDRFRAGAIQRGVDGDDASEWRLLVGGKSLVPSSA